MREAGTIWFIHSCRFLEEQVRIVRFKIYSVKYNDWNKLIENRTITANG